MSLPDAAAWRIFTYRLFMGAGVASLGAGAVFFVAANWTQYGVMGRFAIIEVALAAAVGVALWRPPPGTIGESGLALATILTGALLALFGQSYQTGADLYELFFTWALLTTLFALASRVGAVWAIWWVILNVGLALVCGLQETSLLRWAWMGSLGIERPLLFFLCALVNIAGAAIFEQVGPAWLARLPYTFGFTFGTLASIFVIFHDLWRPQLGGGIVGQDVLVIAAFAITSAVIAVWTLNRKLDVYPMALIFASWIAISTAVIIRTIRFNELGSFFLISIWLIGTSTAAGFLLMGWVRAWRKPT